jgi:RND family efflux transporter MFP subunit
MTAPKKSARWGLRLLLVAGVLAVAGYLIFIGLRPVAVVATVTRGRAINAVPGSVDVQAEFVAEIKSEVAGRVTSSIVDPGLAVHKGDVLVQIDTGDVDLDIERIKNEITAARRKVEVGSTLRADVLNMRDTVANFEHLAKAGGYPEAELEKQRRLLQQLEQRMDLEEVANKLALDNDENSLRTKEREREKMTIVAPTDGVISVVDLNARTGDLIGRDAPIATLISSTRTVEAKVSEENFAGIRVGQKASVTFLGYGAQLYHATVIKVLPTADAETQRYIVHLEVSDLPVEKLVPGLTGEVSIVIGQRDANAIIPRRALRGNQVLVVNAGTVEVRTVEVGYVSLNDVEVLKGLTEGDLVIVEDLDRFHPGDRVRTKPVQ